jgi:hypothetical protein
MRKVFIVNAIAALVTITTMAQDKQKVAVFDPAGDVDKATKEIVREQIMSILSNTRSYTVLERELVNKVAQEAEYQKFFDTGDMGDIGKIGASLKADKVFVSNITKKGDELYISCKIVNISDMAIDANEGDMIRQKYLVDDVKRLVTEMIAKIDENMLTVEGRRVYEKGAKLRNSEVRSKMLGTDALRLYEKGRSRNATGNVFLLSGLGLIAGGVYVVAAQPFNGSKYTETGLNIRNYDYSYSDNNPYVYYDDAAGTNVTIGGVAIGVGVAAAITGIIIKATSKSYIKESVKKYNSSKSKTTSMNMKLDVTGNKLGLTLNF